ncbi:long-chain-fatty-acid--CoA ligase [Oceanomicrobium pacificus]|uniref:3-methylmercaptopropionyl-CoA ligase n=1 Tax=Oceanomicrobium pacificus TaxID=2692916 RepID=A0A6B0TLH7_9RHOB|nr:long-chain-fatty-acid--CoA ligase [Oceanomicrobium pacificus]MXU65380.1 long-chain-fatty-acid--CoA ligase [Oceanomicrobium pacificus]
MHNLMQSYPLRVSEIIDHAARYHGNRPVLTRLQDGTIEETRYADVRTGAMRLAQALRRWGIARGDVVGVMAWNSARMMEVWYGVPGAGAVLHTLNPRLFADQLVYVINHAGNRMLLVDPDLLPVVTAIRDRLDTVEAIIVMSDDGALPADAPAGAMAYAEFVGAEDGDGFWTTGDETDACGICYTSGTTGNPKGVVYTHRSNLLHAMSMLQPDMLGFSSADRVMPVVPLFHANGWSIGFSAPMAGASLVMPGRDLTPAGICQMLDLGVTVTAAVPTVWLMLLQHLEAEGRGLPDLERVFIGGSSCPRAVIETFQNRYGVQVMHAWGMTEISPVGTICSFKPEVRARSGAERVDVQETVGHPPFGVELKITDDADQDLPWDGKTQGRLWTRGAAVLARYLKADAPATDAENWFDTGDVATIDPLGYVRITDRSKDVIKSGGEWISSIDLENAAVGHPDVAEAAAIGMPHPKWDERPLLCVVPKAGATPEKSEIIDLIAQHVAKWQLPDDVIFLDALPHTATGKISKLHLREQIHASGYSLPG